MMGPIEKLEAREETSSSSFRSAPVTDAAAVNVAFSRGAVLPVGTRDGMAVVWEPKEAARTRGGSEMVRDSHTSVEVAVIL